MASQTITTTDHDEIKAWVEHHDGRPASVRGTADDDEAGILRIDLPGGTGSGGLIHIDWEDWFAKFEEQELAFLYQDHKADGSDSTFFRLIRREP